MKKLLLTSALSIVLFVSGAATAQFQTNTPQPSLQQGGFNGPTSAITTVAEALKSKDDTNVILVGKIEKETGHNKYLFKDGTGSIILDIDKEDWRGTIVTPNDTVQIQGEIDKDLIGEPEVDVDTIIKK